MFVRLLVMMMVTAAPAGVSGQEQASVARVAADRRAEAYFEFISGLHLESEGQVDGAIEAYRRAAALDPTSAEILAELAGLYSRQNRADDAVRVAEAALAIDAENTEAHWVLGSVYAVRAQSGSDDRPAAAEALEKAVLHLEKARPARRYDFGLSLALGRLYLRKSDYPKAIELLEWLNNQSSGAPEVSFLLAQAYEGGQRRDEALAMLREAVEAEPRFFRAWVMLGELLERERRFAEAADAYGQAAAQNPRSVELRLRRAGVLLSADRTTEARDVLREVVKDAPTDGTALYLLADAERQLKDFDEAESVAKRLAALEPRQVRGLYSLALVYEARREHAKVIEVLDRATSQAKDDRGRPMAPLFVRLGAAHQALGDFDQAVAAFEQAKAAGGGDPVFDLYLAQALIEAGQPARALTLTTAARKARPDDLRFARLEASALAKTGQLPGAIALLEEEAARHVDSPDAQIALAALCAEHERFDCAMAALDKAERQFPDELPVVFQRGAVLEQQRRYDEAEEAFRTALSRDPLHGPTLNYLGYMLAERGVRLDEAVALVERAVATDPWNPSYLDSLGWAHFKRGDLDKARKYLSPAAERLPFNSVVQDHWGDLLMRQGDRAAAIAAWELALKGDRDSIDPEAISRKIADARRGRP